MKEKINPDKNLVNSKSGYSEESFQENLDQLKKAFDRILKLKNSDLFFKLEKSESDIIENYLSSYKKKIENIKFTNKDFFLTGQDILKISKINDQNLLRFLIYRYKYSVYPKLFKVDDYPPNIQIEPTSVCNFRCVMCYQADKSFSNKSNGFMGHMDIDLFKKIIDEIEGKIEAVTLASRGEPTLNPKIIEMVQYCKNKFLGFKINTNASLLNENLIKNLLDANFAEIVFSADAADKETYEKIRINGKYEKVFKNLELFSQIKKSDFPNSNTLTKISGVKIKESQNIEEMKTKVGKYVDVVQLVDYTPWESSYDNPVGYTNEPCHQLWHRMFVWQDGKANPCDYDYKSKLSKWNVKDNTISEIWNSDEYNDYRSMHINNMRKDLYPCDRCTFGNA
jgi:radical SAM protein with 4Fe4S-binding SPASM domain